MKIGRYGLMMAVALFAVLVYLIWPVVPKGGAISHDPASGRMAGEPMERTELGSPLARQRRTARIGEPKPWKADPEVIGMYSEEAFLQGDFKHSDLAIFYDQEGFTDYYGLMHGALSGDPEALSAIFTSPVTDGSASEGFAVGIEQLLGQLGDRYFAHQLSRQTIKVQRRIIEAAWPGQFDRIAAGQVPVLGNQMCTATAQLAARIKEAEQATP